MSNELLDYCLFGISFRKRRQASWWVALSNLWIEKCFQVKESIFRKEKMPFSGIWKYNHLLVRNLLDA
ncbi:MULTISPECIES: hypothetical protein [Methanosarcina]|uniref:hypothetical protein n=1 Tax=Methanosarcina TaxID=2207 RepID=UPI0006D01C35|nr:MULTISPECIES: hypothetical protein [Methanosarcina]